MNKRRRNTKPGPPGRLTRLKTLVKKGDLAGVRKLIGESEASSVNSLLITCTTPYFSYPKIDSHADIARYLVHQGADPDVRESEGPVLVLAAKTGSTALVEALLEAGATVDFYAAAAILDLSVLEQLLQQDRTLGKAVDRAGFSGLHYCAGSALGRTCDTLQRVQLRAVDLLLATGADPNLEVGLLAATPLVSCCTTGGSVPVIHRLVAAGADPNHPWALRSALRHFKQRRTSENAVADALVDCGCDVNGLIDDRTCLHLYGHHEEKQAVSWLLDHGASVHATTPDGRTPLHMAAERNNHTSVIQLLLQHGADPDRTDSLGMKPVDYATDNEKHRVVKFLAGE